MPDHPQDPAKSATTGSSGDQSPDTPPREAVYDDEGRFAPSHGVLGLPEWITVPADPHPPRGRPRTDRRRHRQPRRLHGGPRHQPRKDPR